MTDNQYQPELPRHMSFGWLIAVLGADMASTLDKHLKEIGLNIGLWPTLFALWEEDGLTQSELTSRCNTAHYTTTRLLDSLEKMELVERRPHPTSRRAHLVYLTEKGRELESKAAPLAKQCNEEFLSALSSSERAQITGLVKKVIAGRNPKLKL
ncbi:MarR family transcriptional regulator [Thalassomonas viridans]|uniref:MarR family transcriptional regulator n=1 Tax=Thalassomonas viridans TaxID=137584 RepID=A0AAE9Z9Y4_9GAMM|nr:MarR family transcriptional regulator [Thalassomonas viridans]WDE08720.1 MarR family transcriptional regulator [Thalassomonas viridans]